MLNRLGIASLITAAAAAMGCGAMPGDDPDNGDAWQAFTLPVDDAGDDHGADTVLGIHCESADRCVAGTTSPTGGAIVAMSADGVEGVVLTGDEVVERASSGVFADVGFLGFDRVGGRLAARLTTSTAYVTAAGDGTSADQWTVAGIGELEGLNAQIMFAELDGTWIHLRNGVLWGADAAPGDTTTWTGLWAPGRNPPFPADYDAMKAADDTICNSDPQASTSAPQIEFAAALSNLGVIVYPAAGLNQGGVSADDIDAPGVCISVDGGYTFHQQPFPDLAPGDLGPRGITCTDDDHCWAYKAYQFGDDNPYLFYTSNAGMGLGMTWTRAQLPAVDLLGATFRHVFFAPDNTHGWLVGSFDSRSPLLFATSDGGATWQDLSPGVAAVMGDAELTSGHAASATQIWIGGENGALLASGSGGR